MANIVFKNELNLDSSVDQFSQAASATVGSDSIYVYEIGGNKRLRRLDSAQIVTSSTPELSVYTPAGLMSYNDMITPNGNDYYLFGTSLGGGDTGVVLVYEADSKNPVRDTSGDTFFMFFYDPTHTVLIEGAGDAPSYKSLIKTYDNATGDSFDFDSELFSTTSPANTYYGVSALIPTGPYVFQAGQTASSLVFLTKINANHSLGAVNSVSVYPAIGIGYPHKMISLGDDRVLLLYWDQGNSGYAHAVVGKVVNDTTVTWGVPIVFKSAWISFQLIRQNWHYYVYDNSVFLFYADDNNETSTKRLVRFDINQTSITLSNELIVPNVGRIQSGSISYIPSIDEVRLFFVDSSNNLLMRAYDGGLSGSSAYTITSNIMETEYPESVITLPSFIIGDITETEYPESVITLPSFIVGDITENEYPESAITSPLFIIGSITETEYPESVIILPLFIIGNITETEYPESRLGKLPIEQHLFNYINQNSTLDWYYPRIPETATSPYGHIEVITNRTQRLTQRDDHTYSGQIRIQLKIYSDNRYELPSLMTNTISLFPNNLRLTNTYNMNTQLSRRLVLQDLESMKYFVTQDVILTYYTKDS